MFEMAAMETLTSEQSAHKEFSDSCYNGNNYKFGQSYSMTSYIGKPEERPSKINNHNNVLETSLFTSDGIVLSTTQEMHCGDFVLTEDTDNHAADAEIEGSEKHVTVTIHRSSLKNYRAEECKERILANCADEHGAAASESPAKVKENETFSNDEAIFEQDGPLSLKERISNVDMSIEWIKGELTLMQAQDLSLRQQFEKLFKDVMELKLHLEMERDEYQFIEEEISF